MPHMVRTFSENANNYFWLINNFNRIAKGVSTYDPYLNFQIKILGKF